MENENSENWIISYSRFKRSDSGEIPQLIETDSSWQNKVCYRLSQPASFFVDKQIADSIENEQDAGDRLENNFPLEQSFRRAGFFNWRNDD